MLLWGGITPEMWGEMQSPPLLACVRSAKDAHGWAGAAGQWVTTAFPFLGTVASALF